MLSEAHRTSPLAGKPFNATSEKQLKRCDSHRFPTAPDQGFEQGTHG